MRIRAEVSMFSKEAATRAPLQNMLQARGGRYFGIVSYFRYLHYTE